MFRQAGEAFQKYRERIKEEAKNLKEYLKGRIVTGTKVDYVPKNKIRVSTKCQQRVDREHRKVMNKMARKSRRINRLRAE